jgi:hypothetical protein
MRTAWRLVNLECTRRPNRRSPWSPPRSRRRAPTQPGAIQPHRIRPRLLVAPAPLGIYRWGWGFSTSEDFNGDIGLITCFVSSLNPAMVRRWHADPFGFLRPWNELPLWQSATRHTPLDRHRRGRLHHGIACRNRRGSSDVQGHMAAKFRSR